MSMQLLQCNKNWRHSTRQSINSNITKMSHQHKVKKMVIKIPRHPFIIAQGELNYDDRVKIRKCRVQIRKCRVIKGIQTAVGNSCQFPLKPKAKRCCVRVARLPDVERSEISVTPASSIVCSDFDEGAATE